MKSIYQTADAIINIDGNTYALFKNGPLSKYPYMVDSSTGEIPYGTQRPLLKSFLIGHSVDIEPWCKKTTHWCVRESIKIASTT